MARKEVYVIEKTNKNDHPRISYYNKIARSVSACSLLCNGSVCNGQRARFTIQSQSPAAVRGWFTDKRTIIYNRGNGLATLN
jgi:hypothetical protein